MSRKQRLILKNRKSGIRCLWVLCAFLLLLSSCNGDPQSGATESPGAEAKHANYMADGLIYGGRAVELGLAEDEKALDLLEEEDGYRLLVGKSISVETPFPQEDGTTLYYSSGALFQTEYRFLNADFTPSGKEAVPTEGMIISAQRINDVLYEFRGEPHVQKPSGTDDGSRYAEYLDAALYADGKELWSIPSDPAESFNLGQVPSTVAIDGETVYQDLYLHQRIYANGKRIPASRDISGQIGDGLPMRILGLMKLGGTVYTLLHDTNERALLIPLSPDLKELEKKGIELKVNASGACDSDGATGFFLSGTELYATDGKECRKLADLARQGFATGTLIRRILPLSDGRILILGEDRLAELSPGAEEKEKQVITLGVIRASERGITQKVLRYNRLSEKYAVSIREYAAPEDLNKAFLSGEIALIASGDRLLLRNYAEKGLLLDLEEGMPALFEEGVLYENLVDNLRVHGKSCFLPPTFWLYGYRINKSLYPEGGFQTTEDFFGFIDEKDPETKKRTERTVAFDFYGLRRLDEWIDWDAGICRFDDGDFEKLLTFCGSCSTREEVEAYLDAHRDGYFKVDMNAFSYGVASGDYDEGGNRYAYFWLPSRTHQGAQISAPYFLGIVKNEKYEEAAKDFMDFVFLTDLAEGTDDFAEGKCLIKNGEKAEEIEGYSINVKENGAILESYGFKSGSEDRAVTEEWIGKADQFIYFNKELNEILNSEANRYFAGEITAEKAAEYIQNRVSIYLTEQG